MVSPSNQGGGGGGGTGRSRWLHSCWVWFWPLLVLSAHAGRAANQTKVTLIDCISQRLPATISPRFQECVDLSASSTGTLYRFVTGFECILRLANAIRPDRTVDVRTLFSAVGDFKGTRFEMAVLQCESPLPAIKFTVCMLERFQEICKNRIRIPRPPPRTRVPPESGGSSRPNSKRPNSKELKHLASQAS